MSRMGEVDTAFVNDPDFSMRPQPLAMISGPWLMPWTRWSFLSERLRLRRVIAGYSWNFLKTMRCHDGLRLDVPDSARWQCPTSRIVSTSIKTSKWVPSRWTSAAWISWGSTRNWLWAHNESLWQGKGCWGMVGRAGNLELATLQPRHPGWFAEWSSTCCQSAAKVQGWSFEQGPQVRGGQGKV